MAGRCRKSYKPTQEYFLSLFSSLMGIAGMCHENCGLD